MDFLHQRNYFEHYNPELLDHIMNRVIPYIGQFERYSETLHYKRIIEILFEDQFTEQDIYFTMGVYLSSLKEDIEEDMEIIRGIFRQFYERVDQILNIINVVFPITLPNFDHLENVKNTVIKEELDKLQIVSFSELKTDEKECSICLDTFEPDSKIRLIDCKHVFHSDCLDTWLLQHDYKCPHCREKIANYKSDI